MSMMVQTTTDEVPELLELIEHRRANGLDTFDEWWQGVYRIVTGPSRAHGRLVLKLGARLTDLADLAGLEAAAPLNIGIDKVDARVPDIAIVRPDVAMTSRTFHSTAEFVVEILSPGETPGAKLGFYADWHVKEYLEIDLAARTCRLLANRDGAWEPITRSEIIDLELATVEGLITD